MKELVISTALLLCLQYAQAQAVIEAPPALEQEDDRIFTKTEVPPTFPGGDTTWRNYLQKTLDGYSPAEYGAKAGKYKVVVRFIVAKDGTVTDVVAETKFGHKMEEKATALIKMGPNWIPAKQNGHAVNAYHRQPVTFVVETE